MAFINKFIIEGKVFNSGIEAANFHGLKTSTFYSRVKSNTEQWKDWKRLGDHKVPARITINNVLYTNIDEAITELCIMKIKQNKFIEYRQTRGESDQSIVAEMPVLDARINSVKYRSITSAVSELCIIKLQREILIGTA